MDNQLIIVKTKQRLNKKSSADYDNLEVWEIIEAIGKVQTEFARRQAKKGEDSKQDIEDIQMLLKRIPLKGGKVNSHYFESVDLPADFLSNKRVSFDGTTKECTEPRHFTVYLAEQANVDDLYKDPERNPSFEWGETFITIMNNKIQIHTNNQFDIVNPVLVYYRQPRRMTIKGEIDPYTGQVATVEQTLEFKDDVIEVLIDEAVLVLAGDIESQLQMQRSVQTIQRNE